MILEHCLHVYVIVKLSRLINVSNVLIDDNCVRTLYYIAMGKQQLFVWNGKWSHIS